jgi:hypothetical protein
MSEPARGFINYLHKVLNLAGLSQRRVPHQAGNEILLLVGHKDSLTRFWIDCTPHSRMRLDKRDFERGVDEEPDGAANSSRRLRAINL